jgi:hypothetical protein
MEPASFAVGIVGLAGLFNSRPEAINRAKDYRSFETDSQTLNAQFEADRLRFERWGHDVGLKSGRLSADHHELLDDEEIVSAVTGLLTSINKVCGPQGAPPQVGNDKARPSNDRAPGGLRRRKLNWAFRGKGERTWQMELFGKSVQQLHNLVPPDQAKDRLPVHRADAEHSGASQGIYPIRKLTRAKTHKEHGWLAEFRQFLAEITEKQGEFANPLTTSC